MRLDSIVGTRANRFTVKEKIRMPKATGGSGILYKCLCDCGKTFYLPSNYLQRHTPRDCGCGIRTPLANKLIREQSKRTGIKSPKLYDLGFMFKSGNPIPLGTTDEKVEHAKEMYKRLSPDTDYFFNFMVDHHLLFLDAKPGKQSGGYMTYFPVHKCPIIFSNFNRTSGDVDVLTHEFGHSFQAYLARNIKVPEYRSPTMESCEIDSMSMEFFAEPYMDLFFDVPDKYRYAHLAQSIEFLPYGVTVDEFQHWIYANPDATLEERDAE
jgi:M3 family oligoendopeptidase